MNIYQSIIKKATNDVFGKMSLYSNSTKRNWYDDNGFYMTVLWISPCNIGGVFLNMGICPLWQDYETIAYSTNYSGRITSSEVPNFMEALLYCRDVSPQGSLDDKLSPDEFEHYYRILLNCAKEKFEVDYKQMSDLNIFCNNLEHREDCKNIENGHIVDLDHAIGEMTAGNTEKAKRLMENAIKYSIRPGTVSEAKEMLSHTESREDWLDYINQRIANGRKVLAENSKKFQFLSKRTFCFEQ